MDRSKITRKLLATGMGAVLMGGLMAPNVSAHTRKFASNVTIRKDGDVFKGSVGNVRGGCQRGRQVILLKKRRDGSNKRIGVTRSNRNGSWSVPTDPRPDRGRYFARARGRTRGGYGHAHTCGGDKSVTINTRN